MTRRRPAPVSVHVSGFVSHIVSGRLHRLPFEGFTFDRKHREDLLKTSRAANPDATL